MSEHGERKSTGGTVPPEVKAEIAYAVTADLVVVGYGEAFVAAALFALASSAFKAFASFGCSSLVTSIVMWQ